jgi:hypothetical protein
MSDQISDDDLKALYARQRTADQERVPGFQAMRTRALEESSRPRSSRIAMPRWAWPVTAAAAAVLAVITFLVAPRSPAPSKTTSREEVLRQIALIDTALQKDLATQRTITAWQSPTDFLLKPTINEIP